MRTYSPKFTVTLIKRVSRNGNGQSQRFLGADRIVNITDFLGEGCSVSIDKNIRNPVGAFTITMVAAPDTNVAGVHDNLYGFIEPMDYVEIRGARSPELYQGRMPILMRGFVRSVRRSEVIGGDGKPQRRVVISGMDYGVIAQIYQIFLRADYVDATSINYIDEMRLFVRSGLFSSPTSAGGFMTSCLSLLNSWLAGMINKNGFDSQVPSKVFSDFSVSQGNVPTFAMQPFEGNLWSLIHGWADCPWNEVFFEDREAGPTLVFRPCPYVDTNGQPILAKSVPRSIDQAAPGGKSPLILPDDAIVTSDLLRSDENVFNFFWVETASSPFTSNEYLNIQSLADSTQIVRGEPNCDPSLYGLRMMNPRSQMIQAIATTQAPIQTALDPIGAVEDYKSWLLLRRDQSKRLNVDNVVFESGSLDIKGNEMAKPGTYLDVQRGALRSSYYVTGVRHHFVPFQTYRTSLTVERGTGFLARVALTKQPALAENPRGVYAKT